IADSARPKWVGRCGGAVQALGSLGDLGWRATRETQRVEQSAERLKRNRLWCAVATRPFDRNAEAERQIAYSIIAHEALPGAPLWSEQGESPNLGTPQRAQGFQTAGARF